MGSSFTSFDSSSAYLVGSQFSGEDDKESNQDRSAHLKKLLPLKLTGRRVLRSASALLQASQLDVNSTSGTEQQWLGRAHGYTLSDPFLGFTPHDNTTAARNAWQYTQLLDSGFAGASAQDEYIGWHPRVPQFHSSWVLPRGWKHPLYEYHNFGDSQLASSSTAASQGSGQSVRMQITRSVPPIRHRRRHYCEMDACEGLSRSFSRPSDLIRHRQAVHGHSTVRYICSSRACSYYCLRKDKMKEHCQKMHDQSRGEEQYGSEPYNRVLEENPQWRWWLTHSI